MADDTYAALEMIRWSSDSWLPYLDDATYWQYSFHRMDLVAKAMEIAQAVIHRRGNAERLRSTLDNLDLQRAMVISEIAENDAAIERLSAEFSAVILQQREGGQRERMPRKPNSSGNLSVIDRVEAVLVAAQGRPVVAEEILVQLGEPLVDIATIRSSLIRLMQTGRAERVGRGQYRVPGTGAAEIPEKSLMEAAE